MRTNWRDFGIGMAAGIALCFVLYFGWGLIRPHRPETANSEITVSNSAVGMDENALIAANAERPNNNAMSPPPQLRPEPRTDVVNVPVIAPEPRTVPPVVRPRPRPEPQDEPPPEDIEPDDDGGKPDY